MTSKFSIDNKELLQRISSGEAVVGIDFGNLIVRELAAFRLAAMDSEPVAEVVSIYGDPEAFGEREIRPLVGIQQMPYGTKLYRHAQPAPVVSADLLHSAASAIEDLLTTKDRTGAGVWFDLPFKLRSAANAQPAPVVPEEKPIPNTLSMYAVDAVAAIAEVKGWNACRAAMLPAAPVRSSMPDGVVTAEHRRVIEMLLSVCGAAFELADDSCQQDVDGEECHVVPSDAFQKLSDALDEIENTLPTEDIDRPDVFLAWSAMPRAALKSLLQAGKSPAIPDGYVMVPKEATLDMLKAGAKQEMKGEAFQYVWQAMLAAAPQPVKGGE